MNRRRLVQIVATLAALSLSSCNSEPQPQPVTVLFVDLTRSTAHSKTSTLADFQAVLDQVASEHGRLLVDIVDANPMAHARIAIDQTFSVPEAQGNRLLERKKLAERRRAAVAAMQALLDGPRPGRSTDLIGAVVSGAQRLQSILGGGRRRLVFLSDMVSTTPPHNLLAQRWDQPAIDRLIADLRAARMLPSLAGVDVWVAGAGLSSGAGLPPATLLEIKALWLAVFAATGAKVTVYAAQLVASQLSTPAATVQPLTKGA
jgi:class 3 adenylate cyclase